MVRSLHRRRTAVLLAAALSAAVLMQMPASAETELSDLNGDGVINVFDYVLAKRDSVEANAPVTLGITSAEGLPGDVVTLEAYLADNTVCTGLSLIADYGDALTLAEGEESVADSGLFASHNPYYAVYEDEHVIQYTTTRTKETDLNGTFLTIDLRIPEDAEPGTVYPVNLLRPVVSSNHESLPMLTVRGKVKVLAPPKADPVPPVLLGIDVSQWQGDIDWVKFRDENDLAFAVLRAGYGRYTSQTDKKFYQNYEGAKAAGVPLGAYWYSYAMSPEEAIQEAHVCAEVIKGCSFEYPIAFDFEEPKQLALPTAQIDAIITAFCTEMESMGYYTTLYCSSYYLNNKVGAGVRSRFDVWVAHYNVSKPSYTGSYGMWQYGTATGINGISGAVDMNYCYKNYPGIIMKASLNGF